MYTVQKVSFWCSLTREFLLLEIKRMDVEIQWFVWKNAILVSSFEGTQFNGLITLEFNRKHLTDLTFSRRKIVNKKFWPTITFRRNTQLADRTFSLYVHLADRTFTRNVPFENRRISWQTIGQHAIGLQNNCRTSQ